MFKPVLVGSSVVLAMVALALAQQKPKEQPTTGPSLVDKQFVLGAASAGMLEVKLGQYASTNASNADVKKFGDQMVTDHSAANDKLKNIASTANIDIPSQLSDADQAELDRLTKLNGADFDKAYASQMVDDHNKAIALFLEEIDNGTNADLKSFAQDTLPTLKHHLEMAKELNGKSM
jgi:putative membrane protein